MIRHIVLFKIKDEFKSEIPQLVKEYLLRFKAISTREENSGKMLEEIDPRIKVQHVSDPTFLPGADFWKEKVKKKETDKGKYEQIGFIVQPA